MNNWNGFPLYVKFYFLGIYLIQRRVFKICEVQLRKVLSSELEITRKKAFVVCFNILAESFSSKDL